MLALVDDSICSKQVGKRLMVDSLGLSFSIFPPLPPHLPPPPPPPHPLLPPLSSQHAVLQFRLVDFTREDGSRGKRVRPYLLDLGSTNKSYVNNKPIEAERYFELQEKVG